MVDDSGDNVIQILPADGWYAKFKDSDGEFIQALACWALIEKKDGDREVVGLMGGECIDSAEGMANFERYLLLETADLAGRRGIPEILR